MVEVENYKEETDKDKWIDGVELIAKGPYGIRADMLSLDELKEMANVSEKDFGYKVITTEDGASFRIKTIKILGDEYFFPQVEDKKMSEQGKLSFYLIPVKGAKIKIQNICGNISLFNENKIYRPELVNDTAGISKTKQTINN